jgi:hypothetical protein
MKKKITLFLLLAGINFNTDAQVVLYEEFTAPFNPIASGWNVQNLSSATGTNTTGWFQGNAAKFDALKGSAGDYYAADMNSTTFAGATNTISCWLITPTLNLVNGAWLQFATKGSKLPTVKPDRIQVYYSLDLGTNVGTTAGSATNTAGTFTNLVLDYNPNLNANYASQWIALTQTLNGIATPTVGRLAIRYYIPDGGPSGPNGNYIGIDEFRYSLPCARPVFFGDPANNNPVCVGKPTTFKIYQTSVVNPVTSYTWHTGATTSITTIVPTTTGVVAHWTLGETTPGCQALDISFYFVDPTPTLSVLQTPTSAICSGGQVTISTTGANTYTYVLGSTSAFTINPIVLTAPQVTASAASQFTVLGKGTGGCVGNETVVINVNPNPTVTINFSKSVTCVKSTVSLSVNGASTYSWSGATSSTLNTFTYSAGTVAGVKQFSVYGVSQDGCMSATAVGVLTVSACTEISEMITAINKLEFYPNPFEDKLHLSEFNGTIEIFNELGQRVFIYTGNALKTIDTSSLVAGIYILRVSGEMGGQKHFRLVKK